LASTVGAHNAGVEGSSPSLSINQTARQSFAVIGRATQSIKRLPGQYLFAACRGHDSEGQAAAIVLDAHGAIEGIGFSSFDCADRCDFDHRYLDFYVRRGLAADMVISALSQWGYGQGIRSLLHDPRVDRWTTVLPGGRPLSYSSSAVVPMSLQVAVIARRRRHSPSAPASGSGLEVQSNPSAGGPGADIRIKSPNFSEPDIRTTHLIWSEVYRKSYRTPWSLTRGSGISAAIRASMRSAPSRAYCRYECQGPGGTNAVHRDVVRAGIRHIGELARRMDGYRGRRQPRRYHTYQC
jgi:hypothetical protein